MISEHPSVSLSPRGRLAGPPRTEGAFELKFHLHECQVEPVIRWARERIAPDPHAGADGTYRIHSLYLDTSALDVYRRSPGFRGSKYRIRRYGEETLVYLERKSKSRGWVRKQRTAVPEAELAWLNGTEAGEDWSGGWFRERLQSLALAPQSQVAYRRLACLGEAEGAPIRLTLDRELRCAPAEALAPFTGDDALLTAAEGTVLELKFRGGLPLLFKELVRDFALSPTAASKYRRSIELCGLDPRTRG